jgi:hypothetical protein
VNRATEKDLLRMTRVDVRAGAQLVAEIIRLKLLNAGGRLFRSVRRANQEIGRGQFTGKSAQV